MTKAALSQRTKARLFQLLPYLSRVDNELHLATRPIARPETTKLSTRHGYVRCLIYHPHPAAPLAVSGCPPVHLQIHGGGFVARHPRLDAHIVKYVASEVGAVVVAVDYDVAPRVQYPIAEQECYDVAEWIVRTGRQRGWDGSRLSVLGISAGGKLAINVAQQAYETDAFELRALQLAYATIDSTRSDRTSPLDRPRVSAAVQQLALDTYFADPSRRSEPLASPIFDRDIARKVPPTLILTGEYDTLGPEMDQFAEDLAKAGVDVTHRMFAETDHGFMHSGPIETVREVLEIVKEHLLTNLA